ncbi:hypothetical protein AVEN_260126-1 [Araneus ventricosus]|uniref:Uncharacterized protein n=1 Tax=Araneus ventricosus TaxID=182803 RepID=A0A4Y2DIJ8_ARAVE|nr:hypothetical protein AVEN_260126-1 [Araneus ventricosus]
MLVGRLSPRSSSPGLTLFLGRPCQCGYFCTVPARGQLNKKMDALSSRTTRKPKKTPVGKPEGEAIQELFWDGSRILNCIQMMRQTTEPALPSAEYHIIPAEVRSAPMDLTITIPVYTVYIWWSRASKPRPPYPEADSLPLEHRGLRELRSNVNKSSHFAEEAERG